MSELRVTSTEVIDGEAAARFIKAPLDAVDVSVILVNYNTGHLLDRCLGDLRKASRGLAVQVVIVDNASRDGSAGELARRFDDCDVILSATNLGFGRANNLALTHCLGRYVLLLNTDAFVGEDSLAKTVAYMDRHTDCGVLGVRLVGRDGAPQPSCRFFPTPANLFFQMTGLGGHYAERLGVDRAGLVPNKVQECDWVPGCFYLARKQALDEVGLFDPRFFMYFEEVDHCRAMQSAGWKVMYFPETEVVHIGGESARSDGELTRQGAQLSHLQAESELLYLRKHHALLGVLSWLALSQVAAFARAMRKLLRGDRDFARALWIDASHRRVAARATRLGARAVR